MELHPHGESAVHIYSTKEHRMALYRSQVLSKVEQVSIYNASTREDSGECRGYGKIEVLGEFAVLGDAAVFGSAVVCDGAAVLPVFDAFRINLRLENRAVSRDSGKPY